MNDTTATGRPDHQRLFDTASEQAGYFTTAQARACGFESPLLAHHVKRGRFVRAARGLYRLRDYPTSPREDLIAAWLRLAPNAVLSHDSALELLGLSDIIPSRTHLTVPRQRRKLSRIQGVIIHTTTRELDPSEVVTRHGIPVTDAARTIVDVAEAGSAPDQVVLAARQAIDRGMATRERIRREARGRGRRVTQLIETAVGAGTR